MIRAIKKAFPLSYLGQIKKADLFILIVVSFVPFVLISTSMPKSLAVPLMTIMLVCCAVQLFRFNKVSLPLQPRWTYGVILGSLYLFFIIVLFRIIFDVRQVESLTLASLFVGTILIFVCSLLYFALNFFYMIVLKLYFPNEFNKKEETQSWTLKRLSRGMDLDMQKRYMDLSIINVTLYFCVFSYFIIWSAQFLPESSDPVMNNIAQWAKSLKQLTFFNWIGLFSLLIAIFSITIPTQIKMEDKAREELEKLQLYR